MLVNRRRRMWVVLSQSFLFPRFFPLYLWYSDALRGQKRVSEPLKLKSEGCKISDVGARNQTCLNCWARPPVPERVFSISVWSFVVLCGLQQVCKIPGILPGPIKLHQDYRHALPHLATSLLLPTDHLLSPACLIFERVSTVLPRLALSLKFCSASQVLLIHVCFTVGGSEVVQYWEGSWVWPYQN